MFHKGQNRMIRSRIDGIIEKAKKSNDPKEIASIYFWDINKEHAFTGANKRTSFIAADVFLQLNGFKFKLSQEYLIDLSKKVRSEAVSYEELKEIFNKGIEPYKKKAIA